MRKKTTKTTLTSAATLTLGMALLSTSALARPSGEDGEKPKEVTYEDYMAKARERFAKVDKDDDGVITKEERKAARKARKNKEGEGRRGGRKGKRGGKRKPGKMLQDRNDDGAITVEDLPKRAARHFEKIDTDGDGEISAEEKSAFIEKMKERREKRRERKGKRRER